MKSKCCRANAELIQTPYILEGHVTRCTHCGLPCEVIKEEPRYMVEQTREKSDDTNT